MELTSYPFNLNPVQEGFLCATPAEDGIVNLLFFSSFSLSKIRGKPRPSGRGWIAWPLQVACLCAQHVQDLGGGSPPVS